MKIKNIIMNLIYVFLIIFSYNTGAAEMKLTEYVKTKEPMLIGTQGQQEYFHMLPAGVPLYKFRSFPEGHTTYIAYINIKGPFSNEKVTSEYSVDPMWAFTVSSDEISDLVKSNPISKEDLVSILKARKITRAELADIVRDWKD